MVSASSPTGKNLVRKVFARLVRTVRASWNTVPASRSKCFRESDAMARSSRSGEEGEGDQCPIAQLDVGVGRHYLQYLLGVLDRRSRPFPPCGGDVLILGRRGEMGGIGIANAASVSDLIGKPDEEGSY